MAQPVNQEGWNSKDMIDKMHKQEPAGLWEVS